MRNLILFFLKFISISTTEDKNTGICYEGSGYYSRIITSKPIKIAFTNIEKIIPIHDKKDEIEDHKSKLMQHYK